MADKKPQWKPTSSGKATPSSGTSKGKSGKPAPVRKSTREKIEEKAPLTTDTSKKGGKKSSKKASANKKKTKGQIVASVLKGFGIAFLSLVLLGFTAGCVVFMYLYSKAEIPSPDKFALAQNAYVYYDDGKTEIGMLAERNRQVIDAKTLPKYVGEAVIASEDRTFFTNSGVDVKGIIRAFTNNILGGKQQGASTLSQQYAERYYLGKTHGYSGKVKEAILALKINRQQTKQEILGNYLNTIYWGRGAYGIEAASEAYFGHPASKLTIEESALLAGIIPAPSAYDPAVNKEAAEKRFNRVLNLMVEDKWLKADARAKMKMPKTIKDEKGSNGHSGQTGYILQHVKQDLINKVGLTEEQIYGGGIRITTTINKAYQKAAYDAIWSIPKRPKGVRAALSAVDPKTGAVVAEYGGDDYQKIQTNAVTQDRESAGSTLKPFCVAAALRDGYSLYDTFQGKNPIYVGKTPIYNYGHVSYGRTNLIRAIALSLNVPFIDLNQKMGADKSLQAMIDAGIPKNTPGLEANVANCLGSANIHNIDLAEAYSTFASGGIHHDAYIVKEVKDAHGDVLYQARPNDEQRVFDEKVAADVITAIKASASYGTSKKLRALHRPVAGKTGTSENNISALQVAMTPNMTVVVSLYNIGPKGEALPIPAFGGEKEITGSTFPSTIALEFMKVALKDVPAENFPGTPTPPKPAPRPTQPAPQPDQNEQQNPGNQNHNSNPNPPNNGHISPHPTPQPQPTPPPTTHTPGIGTNH